MFWNRKGAVVQTETRRTDQESRGDRLLGKGSGTTDGSDEHRSGRRGIICDLKLRVAAPAAMLMALRALGVRRRAVHSVLALFLASHQHLS